MNQGFIIMPRAFWSEDHPLRRATPLARLLYLELLAKANFKSGPRSLERGQCRTSIAELRKALAWKAGHRTEYHTPDSIKKALQFLRREGLIFTRRERGGILVEVVGYDAHQNPTAAPTAAPGNANGSTDGGTRDASTTPRNKEEMAESEGHGSTNGSTELSARRHHGSTRLATGAPDNHHSTCQDKRESTTKQTHGGTTENKGTMPWKNEEQRKENDSATAGAAEAERESFCFTPDEYEEIPMADGTAWRFTLEQREHLEDQYGDCSDILDEYISGIQKSSQHRPKSRKELWRQVHDAAQGIFPWENETTNAEA